MAFIRIRSPSSAPPVLRLEGSTDKIAMRFSGNSSRKLRNNSSARHDFPAPPVPVKPITGASEFSTGESCEWSLFKTFCTAS